MTRASNGRGSVYRSANGRRWEGSASLGEVLGLRWQDIDLDRRTLRVEKNLTWLSWQHGCELRGGGRCGRPARACRDRHSGGSDLASLKTLASKRTLTIHPALLADLKAHRAAQLAERRRRR